MMELFRMLNRVDKRNETILKENTEYGYGLFMEVYLKAMHVFGLAQWRILWMALNTSGQFQEFNYLLINFIFHTQVMGIFLLLRERFS